MTFHEPVSVDEASSYHSIPDDASSVSVHPPTPPSPVSSSPSPPLFEQKEELIAPLRLFAPPVRAYLELEEKRADEHSDSAHLTSRPTSSESFKEKLLPPPPPLPSSATSGPPDVASPPPPPSLPPPVPWLMVLVIASINLNEAFQQNCVWPFIPYMIRTFQLGPDSEIGFWGGLLGASFFLAQLLSSFAWGMISDRVGRRFVLLYGTAACTGATLVFGLSSSYPVALCSRFMAGFLSGTLGTAKVYLSEELDRRNHAKGFSALGFSAGLGGILGPVAGGYLNRPAVQYPTVFSQDGLFGRFPWLLPELASVAIGLTGFVVSIFYLPESRAFLARVQQKREDRARQMAVEAANASRGVLTAAGAPGSVRGSNPPCWSRRACGA